MFPDINEINNKVFTENLLNWLEYEGQSKYDESVTQYEHSVQTAMIAKKNKSSSSLIVAALLHDIGHLILSEDDSKNDFLHHDLNHELVGARWLEKKFPKSVIEPIKLHVPAKRYLCSSNNKYYNKLSEASKKSLEVQGGIMNKKEQRIFKLNNFSKDAIMLRKWDDEAKVKNLTIIPIRTFKNDIIVLLNNK
ncbi:MAG: HD domain-containing protein [Candidatus Puniceispirillales bacterium]|jgi:predicted HD phosphohydrolase|tara:strand:- start:39 stop:617 length:579 start_codon:yes stop_codon:yes gene_type:complete